ncbi:hypothetical protein [Bdellovibrio bacteriovorus]|uniref:hypothetical protein n=1 Tax=Bdellovibrio bacteriovorus TaxID=959 RepID=UPI0035A70940
MTMVNAKLGVNAFGATQTKPENAGPSNMSVTDREKLGGENVGEVLNKIVDANWTDPSKKSSHGRQPELGQGCFLQADADTDEKSGSDESTEEP